MSRSPLLKTKGFYIIVSKKCGFTSLNSLSELLPISKIVPDNRKIIVVYRNPIIRFMSFYHGFIFDRRETFTKDSSKVCIKKIGNKI